MLYPNHFKAVSNFSIDKKSSEFFISAAAFLMRTIYFMRLSAAFCIVLFLQTEKHTRLFFFQYYVHR